jgi:hypothetical protein
MQTHMSGMMEHSLCSVKCLLASDGGHLFCLDGARAPSAVLWVIVHLLCLPGNFLCLLLHSSLAVRKVMIIVIIPSDMP